jgi:hypothetical protein
MTLLEPNNRASPNNEPDIAFKDNETGTRLLIDSATAGDGNSMRKEDEILKTLKEKHSFCGTWKQVSLVKGWYTGNISAGFRKYPSEQKLEIAT